ncbi:BAG family molecular chaperone regulator 7 [Amaranthus tricolor]|uniref:BAG family molecular chaperone regulator 7 n=1 Tax=Amaranthus tricolor TaxID=29722 RepID=UPI00258364A3|nr:BAG family molecular chaperone regulator 7 [Amaranthus tricolor]
MSFRRLEIIDYPSPFPFFPSKPITLIPFNEDDVAFPLFNSFHDSVYDSVTDLIQIETKLPISSSASFKRVIHRVNSPSMYLNSLADRVSALESKFDLLLQIKEKEARLEKMMSEVDRKYSWTAEIKGGSDNLEKKYKWTAEIERDDIKKGKRGERKYQWITELKGKKDGDEKRTYTWKATIGGNDGKKKENEKKEKKCEKKSSGTRIVEIEEPSYDHKAVVLRQAFAKRTDNGKKKEISPVDAAVLIQLSFKAYLIRRSKALRALRELAIAKTKLKDLRALFHNFSYRSRVSRDAEERQKFSEKIIVLLLTVDAIEGADLMVRAAKRSMVDELEAMLDVVDPQPDGRSLSLRRRTFDMPSGTIQKEIAESVAQVVQMLDEENATFEACI